METILSMEILRDERKIFFIQSNSQIKFGEISGKVVKMSKGECDNPPEFYKS